MPNRPFDGVLPIGFMKGRLMFSESSFVWYVFLQWLHSTNVVFENGSIGIQKIWKYLPNVVAKKLFWLWQYGHSVCPWSFLVFIFDERVPKNINIILLRFLLLQNYERRLFALYFGHYLTSTKSENTYTKRLQIHL